MNKIKSFKNAHAKNPVEYSKYWILYR